jgi:hypothetical protein
MASTLGSGPRPTLRPLLLALVAAPAVLHLAGCETESSTPGLWAEGEGWTLVEELRIGSPEGDGPDVFGAVSGLAVTEDGRILVLDNQARELRVFGADGEHLRTVGGDGSGPGEFRGPVGVDVDPADGAIWVVDPQNARYSVHEADGTFRTTHPRPLTFHAWPFPGGFDEDGSLYDAGSTEHLIRMEVTANGPVVRDSLEVPSVLSELVRVQREDGTGVMSMPRPYGPRMHWRLTRQGRLWSGFSDAFRLVLQDPAGTTLAVALRSYEPVPVSRVEADSIRDLYQERIAGFGTDIQVEGNLSPPSHKPAFIGFVVDDEGGVWAEPFRAPDAPRVLDVFQPDGTYLGPVDVDPGLDAVTVLPVFRDDRMYAVVRDELDVPYVVRYRINQEPADGG